MATKKQTEVATVEEVAQLPAEFLQEIEKDAGRGVDDMGMDDVAVPYLYVLQSNSPQVNPDHELYIEGARAGMFYNNVSGEVFDGREVGLTVIPCAYERKYVEWVDRDSGGGFVAEHDIDSDILSKTKLDDKKRPRLDNGNLIVETAYHYVYMLNPNNNRWEEIIIPMKSTFLKKSRRWNKALMSTLVPGTAIRAPRWLYPYKLTTVKESRDSNTWSNVELTRLENPVTVEQYRAAKNFAEQMSQGLIKRGQETTLGEVGDTGGTSRVLDGEDLDGEIPF